MASTGSPAPLEPSAIEKPAIPDFEMIRIVGGGSYGDVWLARSLTGIYRAIKVVWRNRFKETGPYEREFRGLTEFAPISLTAPGQLALLHVGQNEGAGFFYYVMELADDAETGSAIRPETYVPNTLREIRRRRGRLPVAECLEIGVRLAEGLAYLHDRNLVHRDIKPANVILVGGVPKLADIGLVATEDDARTLVGTEGYIPPEGALTAASDVFAVGKVLYELSTGCDRRDFPRLPAEFDQWPDRLAFLRLNDVMVRACDPLPERRYRTAGQLLPDLQALQRGDKIRARTWKRGWQVASAIALGVAIFVGYRTWGHNPPSASPGADGQPAAPRGGIAVLPFSNYSPDPANDFFVDGIIEDLVVNLTKVRELHVAPSLSVASYSKKDVKPATIARELGVTHLLKGSVRRSADKVRVTAELIDARADRSIWTNTYDRELTDVFAIQSELAEQIAASLRVRLTTNERQLIGRRPTENQQAYDLYLQARNKAKAVGNAGSLEALLEVVKLYDDAIAQDPSFALAYSQLCGMHLLLYRYQRLDSTPARLALAERAAAAAVRLAPNDPETRLALGKLAYNGRRDYATALAEYKAAEAGMPNDDQVVLAIGLILRRLGRWDEAIEYLRRAGTLDPRSANIGVFIAETLAALRRYSQAGSVASDFLARFSTSRRLAELKAAARYEIDEDRASYLNAMAALPAAPTDRYRLADLAQAAIRIGDWRAAEAALADPRTPDISDDDVINDYVVLIRARMAFLGGEQGLARTHAEQALAKYRAGKWTEGQQPWIELKIAEANAYCGRVDDALRGIEMARRSTLASRDAADLMLMQPAMGRIYLILGRIDDALDILTKMTTGPCELGPQQIRHDPFWSRQMDDPRFEKIVRATKRL